MKVVVDASLVVPYFLPERFSQAASRWLAGGHDVIAPDLLTIEAGNVLWKKARLGNVTVADAEEILGRIADGAVQLRPSNPLARVAWRLATELDHPIYDCFYLALAVTEDSRLVTADRRFHQRVAAGPLAGRIGWVEDPPPA